MSLIKIQFSCQRHQYNLIDYVSDSVPRKVLMSQHRRGEVESSESFVLNPFQVDLMQ